jgi:hypothetical protein
MSDSFRAVRANWVAIPVPEQPLTAQVKIRSRHPEAPATITPLPDGSLRIDFESPQMAITPGQAAVFYQGELVVGGAWIERNTSRFHVFLPTRAGAPALSLLEAFLQCRLQPVFEGKVM